MVIVISWLIVIGLVAGFGYIVYRLITSLPSLIKEYISLSEGLKREKLKTEKLRMELINEQLKDPNKHRNVSDYV